MNSIKYPFKISLVGAAIATVAACSSAPDVKKTEAQPEKPVKQVEAEQKESLASLPDWYLNQKSVDEEAFYGVGMGEDSDLNDAMRKARLQAYYEVAKNMKSELAGEETMTGNRSGQYRMIINQFVDATPMSGADNADTKVTTRNGKYQVFVLLKLPHDRIHKFMELEQSKERMAILDQSYQRLMKKLKERKEEREKAEDKRFERMQKMAESQAPKPTAPQPAINQ